MFSLLDTNIISELRKRRPDPLVLAFVYGQPLANFSISVVSLAEIRFGISLSSSFDVRHELEEWLSQKVRPMFAGRVQELTEPVLLRWRLMIEQGRKRGRTYSQPDLLLAATAIEHDLTLATRNTKDFGEIEGLKLYNPWLPTP